MHQCKNIAGILYFCYYLRIRYLPIQKRIETNVSGQLSKHTSPHAVTVRYQVKNGNQQSKNAPITIPSVTKALCSFLQDVWILCRSRNPTHIRKVHDQYQRDLSKGDCYRVDCYTFFHEVSILIMESVLITSL